MSLRRSSSYHLFVLKRSRPLYLWRKGNSHLRVDNKHKCAAATEDKFTIKGRVEKINLARKIPNLFQQ